MKKAAPIVTMAEKNILAEGAITSRKLEQKRSHSRSAFPAKETGFLPKKVPTRLILESADMMYKS